MGTKAKKQKRQRARLRPCREKKFEGNAPTERKKLLAKRLSAQAKKITKGRPRLTVNCHRRGMEGKKKLPSLWYTGLQAGLGCKNALV